MYGISVIYILKWFRAGTVSELYCTVIIVLLELSDKKLTWSINWLGD